MLAPLFAPHGGEAAIPEAAAPRVYTEPHKALSGEDWYWVRLPLQYSPRRAAPLLILLHDREEGDADSGKDFIAGSWAAAFHERGWIVAAPTMMKRHRPTWADASDYLVSIARHLRRAYPVSAVLLAGSSAGASAALEYGIKEAWEFDGVAAFGAAGAPRGGPEARRLPVLIAAGARDGKASQSALAAAVALREQGFEDVTFKTYENLSGSLSEAQVNDAAAWVNSRAPAFLRRRALRAERIRSWKSRCASADDWLSLGEWCRTHRFEPQALEAFEKAVQASPDAPRARQAAGYVRAGETWMSRGELEKRPTLPDGRPVRKLAPREKEAARQASEQDLLSPRPEIRQTAAIALGMLAQESSAEPLLRTLRVETEPAVVSALQDALVRLRSKAAAEGLLKWAGDPNIGLEVKARALEVVERLPAEAALAGAMAFYFADEAARPVARCLLANMGEPALARLAPLLAEPDPKKLALTLQAAGEIRSRRASPALVNFLDHPHGCVREAARGALLKLGKPAVPDLVNALDGRGRAPAAELLLRITGAEGPGGDKQKWMEWIRHHRTEIDPPERP